MKLKFKRAAAAALSAAMVFGCFSLPTVAEEAAVGEVTLLADKISITKSDGWFETAYAEWAPMADADGYAVFVKEAAAADSAYKQIDNELIREYATYWRADAVGLKAGSYKLKVVPYINDQLAESAAAETGALTVTAHDRSGFAFSSKSQMKTASGAYKDDGTLRSDAQVLYITKDTAKTVTADIIVDKKGTKQTFTGMQTIIDAKQKGYDTTALDFRIVGTVNLSDLDHISSSEEGIQVKGKSSYSPMNITIEGIGEDATIKGFGIFCRNTANLELRNFAVMACMDDSVSIDTDNANIWVHNLDLFYGNAGSAADQAKGDGTVDMKGDSQYITVSYNHLYDSGKSSLCGMKSESGPNYITYHHNWFDHSDSRHPRIRTMSVHVYNNFFDGNSKYGVGAAEKSAAFVENNVFENCKHPMLSSKQGSDIMENEKTGTPDFSASGTFSGENGGIIKAFNNLISGSDANKYSNSDNTAREPVYYDASDTRANGASTQFDAYLASSRDEVVPDTVKAVAGGKTFDNESLSVSNVNAVPEDVNTVKATVTSYAGRINGGDFPKDRTKYTGLTDASSYAVDAQLKSDVVNYKSSLLSVGGNGTISTGGGDADTEITTTAPAGGDDVSEVTTSTPSGGNNPAPTGGSYVHNFTTDGMTSDNFFTIAGSEKAKAESKTWNGLTFTRALKLNKDGKISFKAASAGKLTVVADKGALLINSKKQSYDSNFVLTMDLAAGDYVITKSSESDIYYIAFETEGGGAAPSENTTSKEEPVTQATTEAEYTQATTTTPVEVKVSEAETSAVKTNGSGSTVVEVKHETDAAGNDTWELIDSDASAKDGSYTGTSAKLTIPIQEVREGVVVIKAKLTPSTVASKWAMMQVWGTDSDGEAKEVIAFASDSDKKLSARTNGSSGTYISTGLAMAATAYDVTLIVDIDSGVATVTVGGKTAVASNIDVASIDSLQFVTSESGSRNLKIENLKVGVSEIIISADSFEDVLDLVRRLVNFDVTDKISAADYDKNGVVTATDAAYLFKETRSKK